MISDYIPLIIPGVIGGLVVAIGNIFYYRYTSSMENKRNILKCQLTDLLLPLYIHLRHIEYENIDSWENFRENKEEFIGVLIKDDEIKKIVSNNLYLASPILSNLLLDFFRFQCDYKYEEFSVSSDSDWIFENFMKLRKTVYIEYHEKKEQYHKNITEPYYFSDFLKLLRFE